MDDYEEICDTTGKKKEKTYKGSFNIRVKPELHRQAARKAVEPGISLNQLIEKAVGQFLNEDKI